MARIRTNTLKSATATTNKPWLSALLLSGVAVLSGACSSTTGSPDPAQDSGGAGAGQGPSAGSNTGGSGAGTGVSGAADGGTAPIGGSAPTAGSADGGASTTPGGSAGMSNAGGVSGMTSGGAGMSGSSAGGGGNGGPWTGWHVSGTTIVDGTGKELIPRGFGLGEWHNIESYMLAFDTPDEGGVGQTKLHDLLVKAMGQANTDAFFAAWNTNLVAPEDIDKWVSWGVNSIRLPINYHEVTSADGVYIEAGFKMIDDFVAACKAKGIYVVLDLHAAPGAQNCEQMSDSPDAIAHLWTQPDMYRKWTIDLWQTIAKRYANEPFVAGYDFFDEPYDVEKDGSFKEGDAVLRKMYLDLTAAVRSVDPNHILFIEGTDWSQDDGFGGLLPAWDPQLVWSGHIYNLDGTALVSLKPYTDLRTSTNRPVWDGETGENNNTWLTTMIANQEAAKMGWNMWTYKKVGDTTQPYTIKTPANWTKMTAYLSGKGSAPAQADAAAIMMELAANAATAKCTYNAGYVKAVFNK